MGYTDLNPSSLNPPATGYGPVPTPLYRVLDTNGDGTGLDNVIGDYSSAEEIFYIQPPAGQVFRIERMMIYMRITKGDFDFDEYGKDQVLTNGIQVRIQNDGGTMTDLTNGIPIKRFGGWIRVCFDVDPAGGDINTDYAVDAMVGARWTFSRAGYPVRLDGDNNERLEVVLNDNFDDPSGSPGDSQIKEHYFMVQGYIESTT